MPPPAPTPACPRCAYDLSGATATWRDTCPLDGTCPECGLGFAWGDVLVPGRIVPRWSFEHARSRVLLRWLTTAARALFILPLWSGLRMEHPIANRRLILFAGVMLLVSHLQFAAAAGFFAYRTAAAYRAWPASPVVDMGEPLNAAVIAVLWPYGIPIKGRGWWVISPALIGVFGWGLVLWFAMLPPSFLLLPQTFRRTRIRHAHLWRLFAYSLTPLPLLAGLWLLVQLQYSNITPIDHFWRTLRNWTRALDPENWPAPLFGAAAAWLAAYWYVGTGRYLRLPHAPAVWAAMLSVSGLLSALVVTLAWLALVT